MSNEVKKKKKKKNKYVEENVRKGLKKSASFTWGLLVNLVIVFFVIKAFSYSFHFAYSLFGDVSKSPLSREYKVIEIPADSSTLEIATALQDGEIIADKYAFFAKVKVKGCANDIVAGQYGLSPSMNFDEIIAIICHENDDEEDAEQTQQNNKEGNELEGTEANTEADIEESDDIENMDEESSEAPDENNEE